MKRETTHGYAYLPGVMQYSAGVVSMPGYELVRVQFLDCLPMEQGFAHIEDHLKGLGLPLTAFCACEMRSPKPFSEVGFYDFNKLYADVLREWGVMKGDDNPIARSNVCPIDNPPQNPSFYAFTYAVPKPNAIGGDFVVAGSGEAPEGTGDYAGNAICPGRTDPDAIAQKARFVLDVMAARLNGLGQTWDRVVTAQMYTVHDPYHVFNNEPDMQRARKQGLTWHLAHPPVNGLEFEMDCRNVSCELVSKG